MFCPCCAGRTIPSIHHPDQSGNFDGDGRSMASGQFEIHRTAEPYKPRIPGDLLSIPLPVITDLPEEFIRHSLPDWIYTTRIQRHAIWDYLSLNQICRAYAARLLLENDNKLSSLYIAEEVLSRRRLPDSSTERGMDESCESSGGTRSGCDHYPREGRDWQGDSPQPRFG